MSIEQQRDAHRADARDGATGRRDEWLDYADRLLDAARALGVARRTRASRLPAPRAATAAPSTASRDSPARSSSRASASSASRAAASTTSPTSTAAASTTGVDPDADDRWVRLDEHAQAKVEAASIALVLDMTRPWIWDRLDARDPAARHRLPRPRRRRRHLPADQLAVVPPRRADLPPLGRRPVVGRRTSPTTSPCTTRSSARTAGCRTASSARTTTTSAGRCTSTPCCGRGCRAPPSSPPAAPRPTSPRSTASCSTPSPSSAPTARR